MGRFRSPRFLRIAVAAGLLSFMCTSLQAGSILQDTFSSAHSWPSSVIVRGQSFTAIPAVANLTTIGFGYRDSNTFLSPSLVTIDLFEGIGYGGSLVDSASMVIATGLGNRIVDFDFSGVTVSPGSFYSFRVTGGPGAGGIYNADDLYAGGTMLDSTGNPLPDDDLTFRVVGFEDVPEPSTALFVGFGLAGLAMWRSKQARDSR